MNFHLMINWLTLFLLAVSIIGTGVYVKNQPGVSENIGSLIILSALMVFITLFISVLNRLFVIHYGIFYWILTLVETGAHIGSYVFLLMAIVKLGKMDRGEEGQPFNAQENRR